MVRQYIGARYIPKFVGAWNNSTVYEALSIVEYNNSSYTSKKPVPVGVGNPATATEYWALSGNTSGQIEDLKDRLDDVESDIEDLQSADVTLDTKIDNVEETLKERNFLLFGDSLFDGFTPSDPTRHGWGYWLKEYLTTKGYNVYTSSDITDTNYGSAFAGDKTYTMHFEKTLEDHPEYADINITDIIIYSGTNDASHTAEETDAGIASFVAKVKEYYPHAEIKIGYFSPIHSGANLSICRVFQKCGKHGASFINGSYNLCCHRAYVSSDNVHLTLDGYAFYSPYLCAGALSGYIEYQFAFSDNAITNATTGITVTNVGLNYRVMPSGVQMFISNIGSTAGSITFTLSGENPAIVGGFMANCPITIDLTAYEFAEYPYYKASDGTFLGMASFRYNTQTLAATREMAITFIGDVGTGKIRVFANRGNFINNM